MNLETATPDERRLKALPFAVASWFSFFIPLLSVPFVLLRTNTHSVPGETHAVSNSISCMFLLQGLAVFLGVFSVFGIIWQWKPFGLLFRGLIGIVSACIIGIMLFVIGVFQ